MGESIKRSVRFWLVSATMMGLSAAADSFEVLDRIRAGFSGEQLSSIWRQKADAEYLNGAGFQACENAKLAIDSRIEEFGTNFSIFDCRTSWMLMVTSTEFLPYVNWIPKITFEHSKSETGLLSLIASDALAQTQTGQSDFLPIVRLICQRPGASGQIVLRSQLDSGECIDQIIDVRSGIIVETIRSVSCSCH